MKEKEELWQVEQEAGRAPVGSGLDLDDYEEEINNNVEEESVGDNDDDDDEETWEEVTAPPIS